VVSSTTPMLGFEASILFDLGVTHSFVSFMVVRTLEPGQAVTTPIGKTLVCKRVVCECPC
jgi:hypothetical protein